MKKIITLILILALSAVLCMPVMAASGTFAGVGTDSYTVTVPETLTPGGSGTVSVSGAWGTSRSVQVTASESVVLTNDLDGGTKTLAVRFNGIDKPGKGASTNVTASETISVAPISNALFGTWTGNITYTVSMVNNGNPELISFTIDGTAYYAEPSMNWAQWLASDYNTADFQIKTINNTTYVANSDATKVVASGSTAVKTTATITAGGEYTLIDAEKPTPILAAGETWYTQGGTTVKRATITEIEIKDSYTPTGTVTASWDASAAKDGSVMAYIEGTKLTIAGNGSGCVFMNEDSSYAFSSETSDLFSNLTRIEGADILDTSNTTSFERLFSQCTKLSHLDVSSWNTGKVENMDSVFNKCSSLEELDVSNWDTNKATTMVAMFQGAIGVTELDLSKWNVGNVTDMSYMFLSTSSLGDMKIKTIGDVSGWDTDDVTNMLGMFQRCTSLTGLNLGSWNVENVSDTSYMFNSCSSLTTLDLSDWDTGNVTTMQSMFSSCASLTSIGNVANWDVGNVTTMQAMFNKCYVLEELDVSNWDVSKVESMRSMFTMYNNGQGESALTQLDVSNWDTSSCTDMAFMFYGLNNVGSVDLSGWDVSKVTTFDHMTAHSYLTIGDTSNWRTPAATNMNGMFHTVQNTTIDISNLDTRNVTSFSQMFDKCDELVEIIGLENFDTSNGLDFSEMFTGCRNLKTLNLSSFDTRKATDGAPSSDNGSTSATMLYMFSSNSKLERIILGENFSFNGDGTTTTNVAVLPTPTATYIAGATGYWYSLPSWDQYRPDEIPNCVAGTYVAMVPTLAENDTWFTQGATIEKSQVTRIDFVSSYTPSGDVVDSWDASSGQKGTVTVYAEDDGSGNGTYKLTVSSMGHKELRLSKNAVYVFGARNASDAFNNVKTISGTDMFNTSLVTNMSYMFANCSALTSLDVSSWYTTGVTNMSNIFAACSSLKSLDVSTKTVNAGTGNAYTAWDMSTVKNMDSIFRNCSSLETLDLSSWNTVSATSMSTTFSNCSALRALNVSGWTTSGVTNMSTLFNGCSALEVLDLSSWSTESVTSNSNMFRYMYKLQSITLGDKFSFTGNGTATAAVLPKPSASYIPGATGSWYSTATGEAFAPADVPSNTADTYFAVPISFTIDGRTYTITPGMTWTQWVNSSRNTDDFQFNWIEDTLYITTADGTKVVALDDTAVAASAAITAGEEYTLINAPATTISFTIDGKSYTADPDMRWTDWLGSDYNTDGYKIVTMGGTDYVANSDGTKVVASGGTAVKTTATITSGTAYTLIDAPWISFTINGTFYIAEEGATWSQWIASEYNTAGYRSFGTSYGLYVATADETKVVALNGTAVEYFDLITDGATYTLIDVPAETISFTIGDTYYNADPGMTWASWLASDYNTAGYKITPINNTTYVTNSAGTKVVASGSTAVLTTATITAGGEYTLIDAPKPTPILAANSTWYTQGGTTVRKSTITEIQIEDSYTPTGTVTSSWDASAAKDGSVMAYIEGTKLTIAGNGSGRVFMNEDSSYAFAYFDELTKIVGADLLDTSGVTDMSSMFSSCAALQTLDLSGWKTSGVTDMSFMFSACDALLTLNVSGWDTSGVTFMDSMFQNCTELQTLDLSSWNTSGVTSMSYMFTNMRMLEKITIGDSFSFTGNGTATAAVLPRPSATYIPGATGSWYSSKTGEAFAPADVPSNTADTYVAVPPTISFTIDGTTYTADPGMIWSQWVTNTNYNTAGYKTVTVGGTDYVANSDGTKVVASGSTAVKTTAAITEGAAYTLVDVEKPTLILAAGSTWYTQGGTTVSKSSITEIQIEDSYTPTGTVTSSWDASAAKDGSVMAYIEGTKLTIAGNGSGCVYMNKDSNNAFSSFTGLTKIVGAGLLNTSGVTYMSGMFNSCSNLTALDLSGWDTSGVTYMQNMFYNCSALQTLDVRGWNTSGVTEMSSMFQSCTALSSLDVSGWDTSGVVSMRWMFDGCSSLAELDLGNWDTSNIRRMDDMFNGMNKLQNITLGDKFSIASQLPTPSATYIPGATGFWYSTTTGEAFAPADVPSNRKDTYVAVPSTISFTIDGTSYTVNTGTTWKEWVADTSYNTAGYKTVTVGGTDYVANSDGTKVVASGSTAVKTTASITAGGEYTLIDAPWISFTIGSTTYYADSGMTWEQWCVSEYNTGDYYCSDGEVWGNQGKKLTTDGEEDYVSPSDPIMVGYHYQANGDPVEGGIPIV